MWLEVSVGENGPSSVLHRGKESPGHFPDPDRAGLKGKQPGAAAKNPFLFSLFMICIRATLVNKTA